MQINNREITAHFNEIAERYDFYKENNNYYYSQLKNTYKSLIPNPEQCSIVELGCGSGDIIAFLNPKNGLGIDISPEMIKTASEKYSSRKNLRFLTGSIDDPGLMEEVFSVNRFDYCIMPDTIEHLSDISMTFSLLSKVMHRNTKIIITWANPVWSPLLNLLETLKLKMPEGPHRWPGMKEVAMILESNNLKVITKGRRVFIPFKIPFVSDAVNQCICKIPLLNKLCLIQYFIGRP